MMPHKQKRGNVPWAICAAPAGGNSCSAHAVAEYAARSSLPPIRRWWRSCTWDSAKPACFAHAVSTECIEPSPSQRRFWLCQRSAPLPEPADWLRRVNAAQTEAELAALRRSVLHGTPYASEGGTARTARRLGLEYTVRERGGEEGGRVITAGHRRSSSLIDRRSTWSLSSTVSSLAHHRWPEWTQKPLFVPFLAVGGSAFLSPALPAITFLLQPFSMFSNR